MPATDQGIEQVEGLENLSSQELVKKTVELLKQVGKNPFTADGSQVSEPPTQDAVNPLNPETQPKDYPDHYEVTKELPDGKRLMAHFGDMTKFGNPFNLPDNSSLEINLTPVDDSQFGFETHNIGLKELPEDFRILLGIPLEHHNWIHVYPREDSPGGGSVDSLLRESVTRQYKNLLILTIQTLHGEQVSAPQL